MSCGLSRFARVLGCFKEGWLGFGIVGMQTFFRTGSFMKILPISFFEKRWDKFEPCFTDNPAPIKLSILEDKILKHHAPESILGHARRGDLAVTLEGGSWNGSVSRSVGPCSGYKTAEGWWTQERLKRGSCARRRSPPATERADDCYERKRR